MKNLHGDTVHVPMSDVELDADDLSMMATASTYEYANKQRKRVERAIIGAIRAGYDGVNVNRDPAPNHDSLGIVSIVPWNCPEPDRANGYRTTQYTWDWFSDTEITEILAADDITDVLADA
jgi:hypothetical protein